MTVRILTCTCIALWLAACGTSDPTENGSKVTCGEGQVTKYHPDTGKPYCVDVGDGGTLADGGELADDADAGSTTGGKDSTTGTGKDSTSGSKDATDTDADEDDVLVGPGCPPVPKETGPGKTGTACTKDSDCLFGQCVFGAPVAGYDPGIGFCTHVCGCPTDCSAENSEAGGYGCSIEKTAANNPKRDGSADPLKLCTRECKTDAQCKAWNPALPDCIKFSTTYIAVSVNGACGKNPFK